MESEFRWCGLTSYPVGLELQAEARRQVEAGGPDMVLGLEHEPVITLGRQSQVDVDVLKVEDGVALAHVSRGGRATLHDPGQLVVYPIVSLQRKGLGVQEFVRKSLEVLQRVVGEFGLAAEVRMDDPGLFTERGKLGFIGLQVSRGVVQHGLSLNVSNPLERFSQIRPCGHSRQEMDSMKDRGIDATPKQVFEVFTNHWQTLLTNKHKIENFSSSKMVCWRSW